KASSGDSPLNPTVSAARVSRSHFPDEYPIHEGPGSFGSGPKSGEAGPGARTRLPCFEMGSGKPERVRGRNNLRTARGAGRSPFWSFQAKTEETITLSAPRLSFYIGVTKPSKIFFVEDFRRELKRTGLSS